MKMVDGTIVDSEGCNRYEVSRVDSYWNRMIRTDEFRRNHHFYTVAGKQMFDQSYYDQE